LGASFDSFNIIDHEQILGSNSSTEIEDSTGELFWSLLRRTMSYFVEYTFVEYTALVVTSEVAMVPLGLLHGVHFII
jgi:hypothetical protein